MCIFLRVLNIPNQIHFPNSCVLLQKSKQGMEILISIAAKIVEYTIQPVGQWLCHSFQYNNNIKNMKNQVVDLEAARDRVRHRVNEAENNVEEIERDVKLWLTKVDDILGKANEVLDNEDKANMSCSQMACPNVKLRHKHSKKAKNLMQEIDELLKKGRFEIVSYRPASSGLVTTTNMDWVTFESRKSIMVELMESLQDANINKIGVWGMAGVGKTTLVREVASQVKKENLFDVVAIATVKQRLDDTGKLRIQGEIADELGLQLDKKETLSGRASLLRTRLTKDSDKLQIQGEIADELDLKLDKKETLSGRASLLQTKTKDETKKILVILDDIWEKLDLSDIGIPSEGCKVVITSRERDIFSEMSVQKEFRLEVLPSKEAWRLFEKLVGDALEDRLRSIARDVSKECAGLPLALVTVANALKNKTEPQWKNALQQLRQPSHTNCTKMQKVIYSAIELSYNHLGNSEVQSFFLFCGHQKDPYIDYTCLLKFCFGLKLFHGTNTLEEARDRMDTLLHDLKDSGLLLDFTSDFVLMHDLVIDAAIVIAPQDENVLLMRGDGPITWPSEEKMKTYKDIFVHDMGIEQFPYALECPKLKFLFVHGKDCPLEISETFCKGMRELKVLGFTKLRISLLPSSINLLTNLKTLCLDQCVLEDIAMIGELRNLEILSLLDSNVEQLPREIGQLTHLRMLDLRNCTELKVIPPNVLSCLIQLEELYVSNSFTQWDVEELNNERASLAELKHLSRLTTLEVHIPDANMLPKDLLFEKLQRYKIFVGDVWDWSDKHENSRALKLKLNTSFHLERGIKMLWNGIENLCLDELKGVMSVIYELDMTGFQQLKHLHVQNNVEIKYIINSTGMVNSDVVFPVLEMLSLKNMINLEEICHGQIPSASFRNLSIMEVEHCEKLKFIFSSTIAKSLPQLQVLEIQECSIMGAIIIKEEGEIEDRDMILFPQLRHLELHLLPKLVSFLNTQKSVINDAGEIIPECELDFHMPILQEQVY